MKTLHPRAQWLRFALLATLVIAILVAFAPMPTVFAGLDGQDILISSDGEEFPTEQVGKGTQAGFAGTGVLEETYPAVTPRDGKPLPAGTDSVIGTDDRTLVSATTKYPNRAIASLVFTYDGVNYFVCTGWFISKNVLATAGHCVYDGGFPMAMYVYPGRNGNIAPFGEHMVTKFFTNKCWKNTQNPGCDYGAVKINSNVGNTVGWFGFAWAASNNFYQGRRVIVNGYPGVPPVGDYGTLWKHKGPIQVVTSTRVGYSIDTSGGQSGSPVYARLDGCGQCGFAIHAYGTGGGAPFAAHNSGTRITQKVFNALCNWRGGC